MEAATRIAEFDPDILIIGGWSQGYEQLLQELRGHVKSPIICIYHGTPYHEGYFGNYLKTVQECLDDGRLDLLSFVHPPTARYYRNVLGMRDRVVWLPHYFEPQKSVKLTSPFRIGIFGGTKNWYKNTCGPIAVAEQYANKTTGVEVAYTRNYEESHSDFLKSMESCHLLIHASFLECYSNMVQEAWARGIPVIMSAANAGLYASPFLIDRQRDVLILKDAIDPVELMTKIESIHEYWPDESKHAYKLGRLHHEQASVHTQELLRFIHNQYQKGVVRGEYPEYNV